MSTDEHQPGLIVPGVAPESFLVVSKCWACPNKFTYDPHNVPSVYVDPDTDEPTDNKAKGVRQPLCNDCFRAINQDRIAQGLPIIVAEE